MSQRAEKRDPARCFCPICSALLEEPVYAPCGHSFCQSCIEAFWDGEEQSTRFSCPQCSRRFRRRPALQRSSKLAAAVETLKRSRLHGSGPGDVRSGDGRMEGMMESLKSVSLRDRKGEKLRVKREQIQQRIQERVEEVKLLQQQVEKINMLADKSVQDSEEIFSELICLIQRRSSELKQQIRSQQEAELSLVRELQQKLQRELRELKELPETQDLSQLLHKFPSLSPLESADGLKLRPPRGFQDVRAAVSELRHKLQDVLGDSWTHLMGPEPKTRADFLKYQPDITNKTLNCYFDPCMLWCQRVKYVKRRLYLEVNCTGMFELVVAYRNLLGPRPEQVHLDPETFDTSWSLQYNYGEYKFCHNKVKTPLSGPWTSRVGLYLDQRTEVLSFYCVTECMTLLHSVQTGSTEPLYVGVRSYFD